MRSRTRAKAQIAALPAELDADEQHCRRSRWGRVARNNRLEIEVRPAADRDDLVRRDAEVVDEGTPEVLAQREDARRAAIDLSFAPGHFVDLGAREW
jgi:hypothetical protein